MNHFSPAFAGKMDAFEMSGELPGFRVMERRRFAREAIGAGMRGTTRHG